MDLIQAYRDQNDVGLDDPQNPNSSSPDSSPPRLLVAKSSAPKVDDTTLALAVAQANQARSRPIDPIQHVVPFNPTYDQLWAPIYGPAHPYAKDGIAQGMRNHKLGFVEDASINPFVFDEQYNTFHKYGYAADPSGNEYIGDLDTLKQNDGVSVYNIPQHEQKRRRMEKKEEESKEEGNNDESAAAAAAGDGEEFNNPASDVWLMKNKKSPWAGKKEGLQTELTEEQKKHAEEYAKKKEEKGAGRENRGGGEAHVDKSTFHGKEERDYQGRSWIAPPKDARANNDQMPVLLYTQKNGAYVEWTY